MTPETLRYLLRVRSGESPSGDIEQLRPQLTQVHGQQAKPDSLARRHRAELRATVLAMPPDQYGDSVNDRALRLGLKPDTAGPFPWCRWCADLPDRRRVEGCVGCGLPFKEDHATLEIATPQSSLYRAQDFGW